MTTNRERLARDLAKIESDLGALRLNFAQGGDLWVAMTTIEIVREQLNEVARSLAAISEEALRQTLAKNKE